MPDHDEIVRLYGPWTPRTPGDAAALLEGYGEPWWIAGGWAIEAFTDVPRPHGDVDPSIPRSGVASLCEHLAGRLDVWQADEGTLRPMVDQGSRAQAEGPGRLRRVRTPPRTRTPGVVARGPARRSPRSSMAP